MVRGWEQCHRTPRERTLKEGLIFALISGASFGFLSILCKLGLHEGIGPVDLLTYRFWLASIIMFVFLAIKDRSLLRPSVKTITRGLILGFVFYGFQSYLFFQALTYIPASTATLIIYFYPMTVTVLSIIFFKMRVTRGICASLILLAAGCALVFYDAFVKGLSMYGAGLALASMAGFSVYLVTVQFFLRDEHPLRVTLYALLATALFYSALHNPLGIFTLNTTGLFIVISLALIPTVLAVSLMYRAIEKIGSAYTSIFSTLEPIVTVLLAARILGEDVVALQILGMSLIITGIVVPNVERLMMQRQRKD
ncbi:MAG: DMT family transporter [Desulfobacterota bacterium]|jgi:drug/metabolite transporter (DMT)-like permease|nr:DMT family transporter [Thermodesulfobacteriota bacterium]